MATPPITNEEFNSRVSAIQQALDAGYQRYGKPTGGKRGCISVAAEALGIGRTTLGDWYRSHTEEIEKSLNFPEENAPRKVSQIAPMEKRTLEGDIDLSRSKANEKAAVAKYKDALRVNRILEERIKELEWAAKLSLKPAEWSTPRRSAKPSEHMPYLFISDEQVGETIDPDETEHSVGYDVSTYQRRHRYLIDTAGYLAQDHTGSTWKYPGIILSFGGDAISGGIHDELAQTDEITPIEAVELVFEERAGAIRRLKEIFGRVEVKSVIGNHGRDTKKPHSKKADAHNHERTINYLLGREFNKDDKVTIQTSKSPDVFFPIYNRNILLTHGDKIGSRGGQGFVGPAATIIRGAQKVILEQAAIGRHIDEVHNGHFHTFMRLSWLWSNGCMPGYSEFAKMNRMRPEPPQQGMAFYHPTRGEVDMKRIDLSDA